MCIPSPRRIPDGVLLCITGAATAAAATLEAVARPPFAAPAAIVICLDGAGERGGDHAGAPPLAPWLGNEGILVEKLPIPLGRTLCRNWLLATAAVRASQWVVFLDAGATPPGGWLERLFTAVERFPEARCWGCRERESVAGGLLLDPTAADTRDMRRLDAPAFALLTPEDDASCRPCLSMPSGCRLFNTERLLEDGGWNLAFSPSWGADRERDMALALKYNALPCVCQEGLVIEPAAPGENPGERRINAFKLAHRFTSQELAILQALPTSNPHGA